MLRGVATDGAPARAEPRANAGTEATGVEGGRLICTTVRAEEGRARAGGPVGSRDGGACAGVGTAAHSGPPTEPPSKSRSTSPDQASPETDLPSKRAIGMFRGTLSPSNLASFKVKLVVYFLLLAL